MPLNQDSATGTPSQILARDYPSPPRVHWFVLFCASICVDVLFTIYAPARYQGLLTSIAVDAWAFYLCVWIRSLDDDARSPFWCDAYVIVQLAAAALETWRNPPFLPALTELLLVFASLVLGIATIFLIRSDLERHYNEREPYGLRLSGVMTLFFSFFYFQYYLRRIAKWREAERLANPGGAMVS